MKLKKSNGLTGIDMVIAVMAIIIFSTIIISMMHNNVLENVKLKKETLAMIYMTEIFENIGIEDYENVTEGNINNLVSEEIRNQYEVQMSVTNHFTGVEDNEDVMKKIQLTLIYEVGEKAYSCSMERMKIKE